MANLSNINGKFVVEQTTGYVGIGTTDPNFLIEAVGTNAELALNAASIYRVRSTSNDEFIITKNGVGDRLVIVGGGNVGIGTSSPVSKLHVVGEARVYTGSSLGYWGVDAGNSYVYFGTNTSNYSLSFQTSGSQRMRIDSGGSIISASEYDYATLQLNSNTTFGERQSTGNTKISRLVIYGGDEQKTGGTGYTYVFNPYDSSSYTFTQGASQTIQGTTFVGDKQIGVHKSAEQITGISLFPSSGGTTTLIINVYGVK